MQLSCYHTPYGQLQIERHTYQDQDGGKTFCPLENGAHIIANATPRHAKQLSSKYAHLNVRAVCSDLEENHGCSETIRYIQKVTNAVGAIAQAKEESWQYQVPELDRPVKSVALSLDGAMLLMKDKGWRESMVGAISLYDKAGERLHSIYLGAPPEHGKAEFKQRFEREVAHAYILKQNMSGLPMAPLTTGHF